MHVLFASGSDGYKELKQHYYVLLLAYRETELTKHLLESAQNTYCTRVLKHINTVTTQTRTLEMARHGISIHTWCRYWCRSEVSVLEISVQSGISFSLVRVRVSLEMCLAGLL